MIFVLFDFFFLFFFNHIYIQYSIYSLSLLSVDVINKYLHSDNSCFTFVVDKSRISFNVDGLL